MKKYTANKTNNYPATNGIKKFADYFSLLDQIDKRLQKEDPEYKKLYYSNGNNENK